MPVASTPGANVATHVSRVVKEYAPFGFSTMHSAVARVTTAGSGTTTKSSYLLLTDDSPVYIESINIVGNDDVTGNDTNYLTVTVKSDNDAGGDPLTHSSVTTQVTAPVMNSIANGKIYEQTVANHVVARSKWVSLEVAKSADHSSINSKDVEVSLRYRRKA